MKPYFLLLFILFYSNLISQTKQNYIDKDYHVIRLSENISSSNYKYQFNGLQVITSSIEPDYSKLSKLSTEIGVPVESMKTVKTAGEKYRIIIPSKEDNPLDNAEMNVLYNQIKEFYEDAYWVKVYDLSHNSHNFIQYHSSQGTHYYYRVQLFSLNRFLNPYEITTLKEQLNVNNILYEFDNDTKYHRYLLETIYTTEKSALSKVKKLKKSTKINASVIRYGNAEVRF